MNAASGIAEDLQGGLIDRLRSLPISLGSIISGRVAADTSLVAWGLAVTTGIGFLVGFRVHDGLLPALAAFGLCVLFGMAFCWLFVALGLMAGSPQAAQGLSFMVFPLTFVSSAYVPVGTMPGWMQAFATHQPITVMSNVVRMLSEGHAAQVVIGHSLQTELLTSLAWTVGIIAVFAPLGRQPTASQLTTKWGEPGATSGHGRSRSTTRASSNRSCSAWWRPMICMLTGRPSTRPIGMATAGLPVVLAGMVSAPLLPTAASNPYSLTRSTPSTDVGIGPLAGKATSGLVAQMMKSTSSKSRAIRTMMSRRKASMFFAVLQLEVIGGDVGRQHDLRREFGFTGGIAITQTDQ